MDGMAGGVEGGCETIAGLLGQCGVLQHAHLKASSISASVRPLRCRKERLVAGGEARTCKQHG